MTSYGIEITDAEIAAGLAAMRGSFCALDVEGALRRAGVPEAAIPSRVADRLLQKQRKAGKVRAVTNRQWEAA